ncbi:rhodanese-like domain-containing protein [Alysiella crassa]|uniref:Thiosulfate sulfurtransferase PspE n=1 Tax=Alysiella crassa TaxID=153491 RepID=A0A376BMD6_9NEIS|nr:Thiosulfate sulfurtransferase PspE precursor [Alysiella crassa]
MKNMNKWLILPLLFAMQACTPSQANNQANDTPTVQTTPPATPQPQTVQKAAGVWIDVRTADEYQAGHLSDAHHIPHDEIAGKIASLVPDKNTPINVYCRSGRRSEIALQELKKLGYTNLTNHGAYDDLVKQGLK